MSSANSVAIETGSRLHFGLWGWGPRYERQFGGAGMMIDRPQVKVVLSPSAGFSAVGPAAERVAQVAEGCVRYWGWKSLPACQIEVTDLPPQHVGFGVGTQLDLAVATGLAHWQGECELGLAELTLAVDRGGRSSVGAHGFDQGGFLVEAGRGPGETLGKLLHRVPVPEEWRVLLMTPSGQQGLSGASERQAFADLPSVAEDVHGRLVQLACDELVPAVSDGEFDRFSQMLYDYGRLAGECYATVQEVPYHSHEALQLVERLRAEGVTGVAQSSWGPTLCAVLPSQAKADEVTDKVNSWFPEGTQQISVARPLNVGARVTQDAG